MVSLHCAPHAVLYRASGSILRLRAPSIGCMHAIRIQMPQWDGSAKSCTARIGLFARLSWPQLSQSHQSTYLDSNHLATVGAWLADCAGHWCHTFGREHIAFR